MLIRRKYTNMTVKILLFFTFYLMSVGGGASREVAGYPGGGVLIKCKYERSYTANPKYFCKSSWTNCDDQIKTGVSNEWKNTGRFSLFDNTSAAEFWVLIRELTVEDSGTYQCAVDIEWNKDLFTPVELKIKEDRDHEKSITVNGHVGGSVNISCKYPQSSSSKPKFLCRRVGSADCNYKASVKESRRWIKEGKFSLYDEGENQTFTVSINNLTNEDSGEYWCGAESDWESDHGYKVYITQIKLTVTAAVPHSTFSPSSVQTQSTHLPNFSTKAPRSVHPEPTHQLNTPVEMTPLNIMPTSPKEIPACLVTLDVWTVFLGYFALDLLLLLLASDPFLPCL
ncbi:polymeric immunoglobulin receptor-like isoform X2 [Salminus brasiliensis]|uniref:polymeric immunoglobulin receptor-like isoform X2 n=1 Tax=Salminus brasiliensis TaxID=930266 RepID=UPI003B83144C